MATNERGSGLMRKRFKLPAGCSCQEFVMREITNKDRTEAALWADQHKSPALTENAYTNLDQRLHEEVRLALVAVNDTPVNLDGAPYMEMDEWTERTMTFAMRGYQHINGVDPEEVGDFIKGAEIVSGSANPRPSSEAISTP